ncbi:TPA: hypothetical protein R4Y14_003059 [Citrobacter freundii]|nr:hypothetical protein [Citrobacter freundii]
MSNIDKEWLQQKIADMEATRDEIPFGLDEDDSNTLAALRIALASLEAEPVAWAHRLINKRNGVVHPWVYGSAEASPSEGDIFNIEVMPLYAAPPVPVVPGKWEQWISDVVEYLEGGIEADGELEAEGSIEAKRLLSRRADMLQGAEPVTTAYKLPTESAREKALAIQLLSVISDLGLPENCPFVDVLNEIDRLQSNSPVIPGCSCGTCRPITLTDMRFVVCQECGNKRCPHANDHRNACTGSNEPGQEGSAYPAAPQQEVK